MADNNDEVRTTSTNQTSQFWSRSLYWINRDTCTFFWVKKRKLVQESMADTQEVCTRGPAQVSSTSLLIVCHQGWKKPRFLEKVFRFF